MRITLSLALKILSLFFWWYGIVFMLSVAPLLGFTIPPEISPEFRGQSYAWDFELMFVAIFVVWGAFLWKAATDPIKHKTFILFTIWATAAHIAAMVVVGVIRVEDLKHLFIDAAALSIPLLLVVFGYRKAFKAP